MTTQELPRGNSVKDTVLPSKCSEIMSWVVKTLMPTPANEIAMYF